MDSTMVNVPQLAGEVAGVKFGDERLTNRLVRVVEALGRRPHDSIPAATATRTELEGTYRFFANEKVTPERILSTHFECTRRRCSEQSVALLVQDTTEVHLTQLTEQMSFLDRQADACRSPIVLHMTARGISNLIGPAASLWNFRAKSMQDAGQSGNSIDATDELPHTSGQKYSALV